MKFIIRTLAICAGFLAAWFASTSSSRGLVPLPVNVHIPPPPFTINQLVRVESRKHQLKPSLVKSIIAAESAFSPSAVSPKGAVGLMQLMPETAKQFGADPAVPEQNVAAGTTYLSWLLHRYAHRHDQLKRTIAAYNAGPGVVDRYHGIPPYRETRRYVALVLRFMRRYERDGLAD